MGSTTRMRRLWLVALCAVPLTGIASVTAPVPDNGKAAAMKEAVSSEKKAQPSEPPSTPVRGQLLYENHCTSCHESTLHIRERRRARTLADLRGWAVHWSTYLKLNWGAEEVDDVVRYLNGKYYKYPATVK